jgi:hypothetical protein
MNAREAVISIWPTSKRIGTLLANPADRPVVMDEGMSGEQADRRYAEAIRPRRGGGFAVWINRRRERFPFPSSLRPGWSRY